jgi:hypothetical protein
MLERIEMYNMLNGIVMSELEKMVAVDMILEGYDYYSKADINEYWNERLNTWTES